ncbi:MAG: efflux RND transporter periplasmic adaptor subunit [Acidobacteriota bacterium]
MTFRRLSPHRSALLSVAAGTLALLTVGCGQPSGADNAADEAPLPRPVRTLEVAEPETARAPSRFSGRLRAAQESLVSFRVPGRIAARTVDIGSRVAQNASLATLDPTDLRLQRDEAEAALSDAQARARNATAEYERVRLLYTNDNVARSALDAALANHESGLAAVEAATRRLDLADTRLGYTALEAPAAGVITDVLAEPGENVTAGQPVVRLAADGALEVEMTVPESLIAQVTRGATIDVEVSALATRFPAVVTEVGLAPRNGSAAFPVIARLEADDDRLRSGMAAEVALSLVGGAALLVPSQAVVADDRGRFVWVVTPDASSRVTDASGAPIEIGTVARRIVTVGQLRPDGLEILDGLAPGERIVTAGANQLDDGQSVRLLARDPLAEILIGS